MPALVPLALLLATIPQTRAFWTVERFVDGQPVQSRVEASLVATGDGLAVYQARGYRFSTLGERDESEQIAAAVAAFERSISPLQDRLFGRPTDRDRNGAVILLLAPLPAGAPHVLAFDQLDEQASLAYGLHSNEGEVLYHDFAYQGNRSVWNVAALAVSYHQLLHWRLDPLETDWSRMLGLYTATLAGVAPARALWGDADPEGRFHAPDDPLSASGWSPLFLRYIQDHFGEGALTAFAERRDQGFPSLVALLAKAESSPRADILADFAMACWLDDRVVGGGRFGFPTLTPPRPYPAIRVRASRPTSGQLAVGVGGMLHLQLVGDGQRPLPLVLQGDAGLRWSARAVALRRTGPDAELAISFGANGLARLDVPDLANGDAVVVAVVANPPDGATFDLRKVQLLWGLGWVPTSTEDRLRRQLQQLPAAVFPDAGRAAGSRVQATLAALSGDTAGEGVAPAITTRYAWSPAAADVVALLEREASKRGLSGERRSFVVRAGEGIEQRWENLVIELPGSDERRWPVVLAAHWDASRSTFGESYLRALNIEDNASGVVTVLEAAAALRHLPHRAPILVALLAGGNHGAVGARALLDQTRGKLSAWIECEAVGVPDATARQLTVLLEGGQLFSRLSGTLAQELRAVGLAPRLEPDAVSPHTGLVPVSAVGVPTLVVRTRPAPATLEGTDLPVVVERQRVAPELVMLLARALANTAAQTAGSS